MINAHDFIYININCTVLMTLLRIFQKVSKLPGLVMADRDSKES